ncbi:helix-turn-helix domain-containing protein [Streptomycetaceae bacterium NBC_01309]
MTEQQRGRRAIETGPTGKTVARNLARLRKLRGYTTRQLSAVLEGNGRAIPASGITRMEKAERQVTADELTALAAALSVSPTALLLPVDAEPNDTIEVTGGGEVTAARAWHWAEGKGPLRLPREGGMAGGRAMYEAMRAYEQGRPYWLVEDEQDAAAERVEPSATPEELRKQSIPLDTFLDAAGYDATPAGDGRFLVRPKRPKEGGASGQGLG